MTDQTLKIPERKYTFMISTQKEGEEEVDKIGHVFVDSIILNIRSFSADGGSGKVMYVCIYVCFYIYTYIYKMFGVKSHPL